MVVIRLARAGAKKRPFYHIVVTNSRNTRDGRYIERLGFYNPIASGNDIRLQINQDRISFWRDKGAQPSERVEYLLKNFAEIASGAIQEEKVKEKAKQDAAKEAKAKAEQAAAEKAAAEAEKAAKEEAVKEEPKSEEPAEQPAE